MVESSPAAPSGGVEKRLRFGIAIKSHLLSKLQCPLVTSCHLEPLTYPFLCHSSGPAVVGGLVGAASTPLSATAAESGPAHMIASLHQAPLAKIGFVVKDAPKLDVCPALRTPHCTLYTSLRYVKQ